MNASKASPGIRISRFAIVGCIGFAVDAGILSALLAFTTHTPVSARLWSVITAATVTWLINRNLVFQRTANSRSEYLKYMLVQSVSALLNFGIYWWLIERYAFFANYPIIALGVGAIVVLLISFVLLDKLVFKHKVSPV